MANLKRRGCSPDWLASRKRVAFSKRSRPLSHVHPLFLCQVRQLLTTPEAKYILTQSGDVGVRWSSVECLNALSAWHLVVVTNSASVRELQQVYDVNGIINHGSALMGSCRSVWSKSTVISLTLRQCVAGRAQPAIFSQFCCLQRPVGNDACRISISPHSYPSLLG